MEEHVMVFFKYGTLIGSAKSYNKAVFSGRTCQGHLPSSSTRNVLTLSNVCSSTISVAQNVGDCCMITTEHRAFGKRNVMSSIVHVLEKKSGGWTKK